VSVGFYTQVVGTSATLPTVASLVAPSNHQGGSTHTFMRAAERLHVTQSSAVWSTSQGCALRSTVFDGDLKLSADGNDWGSGGFISDVHVTGTLDMGIQQQFLVKASTVGSLTASSDSWNLLFMGVEGVTPPSGDQERYISVLPQTKADTRQKPYLQYDQGAWTVQVPHPEPSRTGYNPPSGATSVPIDQCVVWSVPSGSQAEAGAEAGAARADGVRTHVTPASTSAKCVIITPGIYTIAEEVRFEGDGAVVLALGFATFSCATTSKCVTVAADDVSFSGLLLDAAQTDIRQTTDPLFNVVGARASLFDIYARIIAQQNALVRADVMVHVTGHDATLDNTWLWHADHDPWTTSTQSSQSHAHALAMLRSSKAWATADEHSQRQQEQRLRESAPLSAWPYRTDSCYSKHALLVDGAGFTVFALLAEHTHDDVVVWNGDRGATYLFQCEVPYYATGPNGWDASKVAYRVTASIHEGYALGGYVVNPSWVGTYTPFTQTNMFAFEATNTLHKVFAWVNPPGSNSYTNVFQTSDGFTLPFASCAQHGGLLERTACYYTDALPPAPPVGPAPPPSPPHPPHPPNPPPSPPHPPNPPPPVDAMCVITDANGGDLGPKAAQTSDTVATAAECADFCRQSDPQAWFLMYSMPGYCFCYANHARSFPGACYHQPGGVVGTVRSDCHPASTTCSSQSLPF